MDTELAARLAEEREQRNRKEHPAGLREAVREQAATAEKRLGAREAMRQALAASLAAQEKARETMRNARRLKAARRTERPKLWYNPAPGRLEKR